MSDDDTWWRDDDRFLAELREAVREAEVPESFRRAGTAAFGWRTVDAELARLSADSGSPAGAVRAEPEPAGYRSEPTPPTGPRALTFTADAFSIELEIHPDAVRGQLVPAQPGTIRVRGEAGPVATVPVDEVGWFVVAPVPVGRFRLLVRTTAGAAVVTDWIDAAG